MNIEAEKKRLQTKLDKVQKKVQKEEIKRDKAAEIVAKLTPHIEQLCAAEAMLMAQIALFDGHQPISA